MFARSSYHQIFNRNDQDYQRHTHFRVSDLSVFTLLIFSGLALRQTESAREIRFRCEQSRGKGDTSMLGCRLRTDIYC
jgi:hypothetical protein